MPVIPGANESQVLNAGSPVPISSPEERRLEGNALAHLGAGAFALGDAMDVAARREKQRRDVITEQLALQKFREASTKEYATRLTSPKQADDATGYGQVEEFNTNAKGLMDTVAEDMGLSPEVRAGFMAKAGDSLNDMGKELLAKRIAINEKETDALRAQIVSNNSDLAASNPNELGNLLAETELTIRNDPGENPSQMEANILEAKKKVLLGAVAGREEKKDFKSAEVILMKHSAGILDSKERAKLMEDIRDNDYKTANRDVLELTRQEKRVEAAHKALQSKVADGYISALKLAGNDENKRAPVVQEMELDVLSGHLSREAFNQLSGTKVFSKPPDDKYEGDIMAKVFKTNDYAGAVTKVQNDRDAGKVSFDKSAELITRFNALDERKRQDPDHNRLIRVGENMIKDMADPSILGGLTNDLAKRELSTKVNSAVADYYKWVAKNPNGDPSNYAKYLVSDRFDVRTTYKRGDENLLNWNNLDGVNQELEKIKKEGLRIEGKGKLPPEDARRLKDNYTKYLIRKKQLEAEQVQSNSKTFQINSIVPQVAPTRGK